MTLETINRWVTLAANIGVLAGIVVLVIEISQNTQAMNIASRDETVSHTLNFFEQSMDNQVIAIAAYKNHTGAELDGFERYQLLKREYYNFRIFENIFTQYQRGLFSEQEWMKYRRIIKKNFGRNDIAIDMWNSRSGHWTDDFEKEITSLLSEI
jgi:hypothetical protein